MRFVHDKHVQTTMDEVKRASIFFLQSSVLQINPKGVIIRENLKHSF